MSVELEISAASSVYTDTGGTTGAVAGDTLGSWKITSGVLTNSLFTQSNAARRPTLRSSSGIAEVEFTGTTINMGLASPNWSSWTSFGWLMVLRFDSGVASSQYRHVWGKSATSGWANGGCYMNKAPYGTSYTGNFYSEAYTSRSAEVSTPDESTSTRFVLAGTADSTKLCLWVNQQCMTLKSKSGTVALGTSDLRIGDHMDNGGYGAGPNFFLSAFKVWNSAPTGADMLTEIGTQMTTWSVSNTVTPPSSGSGGVIIPGSILSNVLVS